MAELLARHLIVVLGAEAADVLIDILTAQGERLDVVGHARRGDPAFNLAHPAERFVA